MGSPTAVSNANYFGEPPPEYSIATDDKGHFCPAYKGYPIDSIPYVRTNLQEAIVGCWRFKEATDTPAPEPPKPAWKPYRTQEEKIAEEVAKANGISFNAIFARLDEMRERVREMGEQIKALKPPAAELPYRWFNNYIVLTNQCVNAETSTISNVFIRSHIDK
jgi:hypothetical protein